MPRKKNSKQKIQDWVENNPDRWYTTKYEDIAAETGVSSSTVGRYFRLAVAKAANILPSEVKAKREEHIGVHPLEHKLSDGEIAIIQRLFDTGHSVLDIVYITGRSLGTVKKYKPKWKPRQKTTEDTE